MTDEDDERSDEYYETLESYVCDTHVWIKAEEATARAQAFAKGMRSKDARERNEAVVQLVEHLEYDGHRLEKAHLRRLAGRFYKLTGDEDAEVRRNAVRGLTAVSGSDLVRTKAPYEEMVRRLLELARDVDVQVRRNAMDGLVNVVNFGRELVATKAHYEEMVPCLLELTRDEDVQVRQHATEGLFRVQKAAREHHVSFERVTREQVFRLLELSEDGDETVRRLAVMTLVKMSEEEGLLGREERDAVQRRIKEAGG